MLIAGFAPDPEEPVFASTTILPVIKLFVSSVLSWWPLLFATSGAKASSVAVAKQPGFAMYCAVSDSCPICFGQSVHKLRLMFAGMIEFVESLENFRIIDTKIPGKVDDLNVLRQLRS